MDMDYKEHLENIPVNGFTNNKNTCFVNSGLQCILRI